MSIEAFKKQMADIEEFRDNEARNDPQKQAAMVLTFVNQWLRENNYFGMEPHVADEHANQIADKWLMHVYGLTSPARIKQIK